MVSSKYISLAFVLSTLVCPAVLVAQDELYYTKSKLLDNIFLNYDKTSHPSPKIGSPVNVTLGIAVTQIVKVDEKAEGMNLNVWYRLKWKDYRLAWDYKNYKNIKELMIDSDYLWTPDIILGKPLTSEAGKILGTTKDSDDLSWKIMVLSDGTAFFNFPGIINGQCPLNIADYPFDEHKCSFGFSSWAHNELEINLTLREKHPLDFNNYVLNNEWHILGSDSENVAMKFTCCPSKYTNVFFHIDVKRGASSYISNYIIPSILIIILSLMMFILPPEVGKRMEIGINLLLCLSVYLTILNTKMPTRSDVFPLLSKFYGCCIFILTIALLCTCWVVAYYFHDMSGWKIYTMPKFVQIGVLYYLARLLRFSTIQKVYPSDISVDPGDGNKIINVKPEKQTKQPEHSAIQNPNEKNKTTKEEYKKSVNQNINTKNERRKSTKDEPKNEKHDNSFTDETLKIFIKKDIKDKENKGIIVNNAKAAGKENQEKIKDTKNPRKESKEEKNVEKEGVKTEKPESVQMNVMEKKDEDAKNNPELNNAFVKDKKKVSLSNTEHQTTKDKIISDDKVRSENGQNSRSNVPKESKSETSKKTNRVFANTISSNIVETTRKPRKRNKNAEDVGIVNEGTDIKDAVQKETKNIVPEKEHGGKAEEQQSIRQAPLLQKTEDDLAKPEIVVVPKTNDEGGEETDAFDLKTTDDRGFKQHNKKRKHESIKWLSALAEYYAEDLQRKKNRFQWRQAAIILNRLFTILLVISITFSIFAVFFTR